MRSEGFSRGRVDGTVFAGPEGGRRGGPVIAEGTPEQIAAHPGSRSGRFLGPLLKEAVA
ncbi:hypothetical protein [Streptomyces sp. NPDC001833]|uniref:hypothetical protein n=1 Tax=Streptomyces sp. NPDC001833 TaxID=3154658 RepID=UPI003316CE8D